MFRDTSSIINSVLHCLHSPSYLINSELSTLSDEPQLLTQWLKKPISIFIIISISASLAFPSPLFNFNSQQTDQQPTTCQTITKK